MNAQELNEILQGKTISRIEAGTIPGWVVVFFESNDDPKVENGGEPVEFFMTIFVGGFKFDHEEWLHYSNCALHLRAPDGRSTCYNIRDYSSPMPIAAGNTTNLKLPALCDAPEVDQGGRRRYCANRVAENGMLCEEHYEKSQPLPENGGKAQIEVTR